MGNVWTTQKPNKTGHYFHRKLGRDDLQPYDVDLLVMTPDPPTHQFDIPGGVLAIFDGYNWISIEQYYGGETIEYAGPLELPREPEWPESHQLKMAILKEFSDGMEWTGNRLFYRLADKGLTENVGEVRRALAWMREQGIIRFNDNRKYELVIK